MPAVLKRKDRKMKRTKEVYEHTVLDEKSFHDSIIDSISLITSVEAIIHRITFSLNFSYNQICESFGVKFRLHTIGRFSRSNKSIYLFEGWTKIFDLKAHIMTGISDKMKFRSNRFSMISIIPNNPISPIDHKNLILKIEKKLVCSDLKVSEVELAYDFKTDSHKHVPLVFAALRKIIYIPYVIKSESIINSGNQLVSRKKLNAVLHLGSRDKIYERGRDENKFSKKYNDIGEKSKTPGWDKKDLDRVRLERILLRRNLRNQKINNLKDLVEHEISGMNIMHNIIDHYKLKEITKGPYKANHYCLLGALAKMEKKDGYIRQIKRLAVRALKKK